MSLDKLFSKERGILNNNIEIFLYQIATSQDKEKMMNLDIKENIDELTKAAKIHKLRDPFMMWDRNITIKGVNWTKKQDQEKKKLSEFNKIVSEFNNNKIPFLTLKGLAMNKYYPKDLPRQSYDYDFLVKDVNTFWECANILNNMGYEYHSIPVLTFDQQHLGMIKFLKQIDSETVINIEINVGGFLISEITWFKDNDLWENICELEYKEIKIPIPSNEINIVILVGEAGGNEMFRIRDAIDFKYLTNYKDIDWDYTLGKINEMSLYKDFMSLEKIYRLLEASKFNKTKKGLMNFLKWRFRREFFHIIPHSIKKKGYLKRLFYHYIKLIGEFFINKDKCLMAVKKLEFIMPPNKRFHSGVLTHFIPLVSNIRGNWEWRKVKKFDLVRTPIGVFLVSNFCLHEEKEIEEATEIAMNEFGKRRTQNAS